MEVVIASNIVVGDPVVTTASFVGSCDGVKVEKGNPACDVSSVSTSIPLSVDVVCALSELLSVVIDSVVTFG